MIKPKFNTKLIIDIAIADLAIDIIPTLLSRVVSIPGISNNIIGGIGTWLAGMIFKRPNISDAAIALTVSTEVGKYLTTALLGAPATTKVGDFVALPESTLSDYNNSNDLTPMSVIRNSIYN